MGLAHAAQALDGLLFAGEILEGDADDALGTVVDHLEVLDVALVEKDLGDGLLHLGRRNVDGLMLGASGVADAGQHIGNGVGDLHVVFLLYLELPGFSRFHTEVLRQYLIGRSLSVWLSRSSLHSAFAFLLCSASSRLPGFASGTEHSRNSSGCFCGFGFIKHCFRREVKTALCSPEIPRQKCDL